MAKRPGQFKSQSKSHGKRRKQADKRRQPWERHYPSFWEKSAQQLVALALTAGLFAWGLHANFYIFATETRPGFALRDVLNGPMLWALLTSGDVFKYLLLIGYLVFVCFMIFLVALVVNFWVQWTWHELKPLLGIPPLSARMPDDAKDKKQDKSRKASKAAPSDQARPATQPSPPAPSEKEGTA